MNGSQGGKMQEEFVSEAIEEWDSNIWISYPDFIQIQLLMRWERYVIQN